MLPVETDEWKSVSILIYYVAERSRRKKRTRIGHAIYVFFMHDNWRESLFALSRDRNCEKTVNIERILLSENPKF